MPELTLACSKRACIPQSKPFDILYLAHRDWVYLDDDRVLRRLLEKASDRGKLRIKLEEVKLGGFSDCTDLGDVLIQLNLPGTFADLPEMCTVLYAPDRFKHKPYKSLC